MWRSEDKLQEAVLSFHRLLKISFRSIAWRQGLQSSGPSCLPQSSSWNVIGRHNLLGSGTIRCGFVRVSMTLLEDICHGGDKV